jgi:hypothetical protein
MTKDRFWQNWNIYAKLKKFGVKLWGVQHICLVVQMGENKIH